jgi:intraflagellar transport protein 74
MRPASAARTPTASRLGTGGMGGAGGNSLAGASGGGRPVTQQGLAAMRGSTPGGSGRMVQDASYFIAVIRAKVDEVLAEIGRMRGETGRSAKEGAVGVALERKYEAGVKEVRGLEGELADYNLAMDKARSNVELSEINGYFTAVKRRNEATTREMDAVFIERQERERGAARLEDAIKELHGAAEARIASLPASGRAEYKALAEASREHAGVIARLQAELEATNAEIENAEEVLRRDRSRDEYAVLEKRVAALVREKAGLEVEMETTRLDPASAREKLLAKVREDNARLQALDRQRKDVDEANEAKRRVVADLAADIEERKGEAGDSAKYEQLFKRDQEMTEFNDRFPDAKAREIAEARALGDAIVALLEHISEGVEREGAMPSVAQAEEMKEDLVDKRRELVASETTADRLQEELSLRRTELDKIAQLDSKIASELAGLDGRMAAMRADLARFSDAASLRRESEGRKVALAEQAAASRARRDAARPAVQAASAEYERMRGLVARDSQATALEAVEGKVKAAEGVVAQLQDCECAPPVPTRPPSAHPPPAPLCAVVASKDRESAYGPLKKEVLALLVQRNEQLIAMTSRTNVRS